MILGVFDGARLANFLVVMSGSDRSRAEQIRALIEEVDRIRTESEQVRNQADRSMKYPFWPERRRSPRIPNPGGSSDDNTNGA